MRLWFSRRVLKILVYASHNFAFEITLSRAITLTLLLACSFSPRVHSIPRGPLFSRIFRFLEKLKKAQIIGF